MFQFGVGVVFILHGLVHLLWFIVPWRITTVGSLLHSTSLLAGRIDGGDVGVKIFGLLWLAATRGSVISGVGVIDARRLS